MGEDPGLLGAAAKKSIGKSHRVPAIQIPDRTSSDLLNSQWPSKQTVPCVRPCPSFARNARLSQLDRAGKVLLFCSQPSNAPSAPSAGHRALPSLRRKSAASPEPSRVRPRLRSQASSLPLLPSPGPRPAARHRLPPTRIWPVVVSPRSRFSSRTTSSTPSPTRPSPRSASVRPS